ncbi:MAG: hypothetical protein QOJ99_5260 [Bryobacterales bacterium]|jgi:hypothetical protein|nr:hypothetical protein [Bryobacterales bacterium]
MTQQQNRRDGTQVPYCEIKERLADDFVFAVREFVALQSDQAQAVIAGESDFTRFDDLLHMARERKDNAKYLLIAHIEEHHCS